MSIKSPFSRGFMSHIASIAGERQAICKFLNEAHFEEDNQIDLGALLPKIRDSCYTMTTREFLNMGKVVQVLLWSVAGHIDRYRDANPDLDSCSLDVATIRLLEPIGLFEWMIPEAEEESAPESPSPKPSKPNSGSRHRPLVFESIKKTSGTNPKRKALSPVSGPEKRPRTKSPIGYKNNTISNSSSTNQFGQTLRRVTPFHTEEPDTDNSSSDEPVEKCRAAEAEEDAEEAEAEEAEAEEAETEEAEAEEAETEEAATSASDELEVDGGQDNNAGPKMTDTIEPADLASELPRNNDSNTHDEVIAGTIQPGKETKDTPAKENINKPDQEMPNAPQPVQEAIEPKDTTSNYYPADENELRPTTKNLAHQLDTISDGSQEKIAVASGLPTLMDVLATAAAAESASRSPGPVTPSSAFRENQFQPINDGVNLLAQSLADGRLSRGPTRAAQSKPAKKKKTASSMHLPFEQLPELEDSLAQDFPLTSGASYTSPPKSQTKSGSNAPSKAPSKALSSPDLWTIEELITINNDILQYSDWAALLKEYKSSPGQSEQLLVGAIAGLAIDERKSMTNHMAPLLGHSSFRDVMNLVAATETATFSNRIQSCLTSYIAHLFREKAIDDSILELGDDIKPFQNREHFSRKFMDDYYKSLPLEKAAVDRIKKTMPDKMREGQRYAVLIGIVGPGILLLTSKHLKLPKTLGRISHEKWLELLERINNTQDFQALARSFSNDMIAKISPGQQREFLSPIPISIVDDTPMGHVLGEVLSQQSTPCPDSQIAPI